MFGQSPIQQQQLINRLSYGVTKSNLTNKEVSDEQIKANYFKGKTYQLDFNINSNLNNLNDHFSLSRKFASNSIPFYLSEKNFGKMLSVDYESNLSPLETFLITNHLKAYLIKNIKNEIPNVTNSNIVR
jgi:hypothetical protein